MGERVATGSPERSRRVATAPTSHPGTTLEPMTWILCLLGMHTRHYHPDGTWECGRCPRGGAVL